METQKLPGLIMAIIGFIMILINAIAYIFDLDIKSPALVVLGIVFLVIGMGIVKKQKNNYPKTR